MLKLMIGVANATIFSLVQRFQKPQMKETLEENFGTIASYSQGTLLLLKNCVELPTDTVGLLTDTMNSRTNEELCGYRKSIYYNHKRIYNMIDFLSYLNIAELE